MTIGPTFDEVIENLSGDGPLKAATIYSLSEPPAEALYALRQVWLSIDVDRRRKVMARLAESSETDFQVDFSAVALMALDDEDSEVRLHSIETLWANDSLLVMNVLIERLGSDPSTDVRATAADTLGKFVLHGETGEIPRAAGRSAEQTLLNTLTQNPERSAIYLRALGSVAYSSRDEVTTLIEKAARHESIEVRAAALLSMGRHVDERWNAFILSALNDAEPILRFEAARACGESGMEEAVPRLVELTSEDDREIKEIAIWALGEIGGPDAQAALVRLSDQETDEDLLASIEDAVNMAAIMGGDLSMYILPRDDDDVLGDWDGDNDSAMLN